MKHIAVLIYALILIVGATYMVQVYNWSMWIYALVLCFLPSTSKNSEADDDLAKKIKKLYETHDVTVSENGMGRWSVSVQKKTDKKIIID